MLALMDTIRVALAQLAPSLGELDRNLARHHELLDEARADKADLVVFPELGLTGYQLQDLAAEVAMRLDDPRLADLAAATEGLSAVVSFVEESADHRLFIAAALLEDGEIRHVHRKLFLPTYGLFDERRFFAPGDMLRAVPSRLGLGLGIAVCEDFWHLSVPQLLALDGAQILINVSSSPGRDLAATNEVGLGTATSWRTLMRTYAQLTTWFVVFCNRVGVDESISFWGGSEVIAPTGAALLSAPMYDEGLFTRGHRPRPTSAASGSRCRSCATSDRSSWSRELAADRRRAGGHGARLDERAGCRARSGRGARRSFAASPIGLSPGGGGDDERRSPSSCPPSSRSTRTSRGGSSGSSSAASCARRASSGPSSACPAASTRPWSPTSSPKRSARTSCCACSCRIGPRRLPRAPTPRRSFAAWAAASELVEITPMVDGFYGPETDASDLRRGNFMARMRMSVLYDRSVTWGGLVVGTGNKTESLIGYTTIFGDSACAFNPIGDLYKSQVRQLAAAMACPTRSSARRRRRTCGPARPTRPRSGFSYPELDRLLFWRIDKRRSIDEVVALGFERDLVERVDRMVAGAEFKRQVPPIAKLGPRTAGVDYLYPRRRPGSARE